MNRLGMILLGVFILLLNSNIKSMNIRLDVKSSSRQVIYAVEKLKELQHTFGIVFSENKADLTIRATVDTVHLKREAYKIVSQNNLVEVTGGDAVGLLYGLLEIRNQLKSNKLPLQSKEESPNLQFRAIKYNLPWDSYRYKAYFNALLSLIEINSDFL